MKVITKSFLSLTEEERMILNTAAALLGRISKADINQDIADFFLGCCTFEDFNELSDLIYKIAAVAENE